MNNRAIRLEIAKPLDESWNDAGQLLRLLANATPKLLNAAHDARVAVGVAGKEAVKAAVAPDTKGGSPDTLAYQAVIRESERLQAWGTKKKNRYATLEVPGSMASAISRAACQAYGRRDQGRVSFASERILVRAAETKVTQDANGIVLAVKLRTKGTVRFAIRHSTGSHRDTIREIVSGKRSHGDCKFQYDERRKKWYALLSYEANEAAPMTVDPARALVVHRGIQNAIYLLPSTGQSAVKLPGAKFIGQRRKLQARMRDMRQVAAAERGGGAKGHGKSRRFESYDALEGKLARVTKTWCQQAAAFVQQTAERMGCGLVVIEGYGGIEPNEDVHLRRVLDRFPLYQLKESIVHRCKSNGHTVEEAGSTYISSTCPACGNQDTRQHNTRTNTFHCSVCDLARPADWVAAYWMLKRSNADSSTLDEQLRRQLELAANLNKEAV
jgi:transposase